MTKTTAVRLNVDALLFSRTTTTHQQILYSAVTFAKTRGDIVSTTNSKSGEVVIFRHSKPEEFVQAFQEIPGVTAEVLRLVKV